ncbi:MAG: hypothetical protein IKP64_04720, partial [Selenomonadaceae bacterium]|nr:hypothetical protein [Selenomonadaceae bacterium]
VQFEIEDKDADKARLPYRPPCNGIIFLPEVGDSVEVFFANGECYVATTLRAKALDEPFRNVADKYLINREQQIFFREKSLEFKSAETSIFMDEKKIVLSVGKNKIVLDERGITLQTGGAIMTEAAKDFLTKIGGQVALNASGNVALNGSKFEVTANGVAAIKAETVKLG